LMAAPRGHGVARNLNFDVRSRLYNPRGDPNVAHSPQPSNHSEITTTSSNSDSGIGFHNDFANISDRIVVVDFPGLAPQPHLRNATSYGRPVGISNDYSLHQDNLRNVHVRSRPDLVEFIRAKPDGPVAHAKSKSADFNSPSTSGKMLAQSRLTVRAMPDPKVLQRDEAPAEPIYDNLREMPVDVPVQMDQYLRRHHYHPHPALIAARSCDDMTFGKDSTETIVPLYQNLKMSVDNISMLGDNSHRQSVEDQQHNFRMPVKPVKKQKKATPHTRRSLNACLSPAQPPATKSGPDADKILSYKLSPKVFGLPRPISMSLENLTLKSKKQCKPWKAASSGGGPVDDFTIWGSLQDLRTARSGADKGERHLSAAESTSVVDGTYSEPDLRCDEVSVFDYLFMSFKSIFSFLGLLMIR
jgi:regulator of G-protein signaling